MHDPSEDAGADRIEWRLGRARGWVSDDRKPEEMRTMQVPSGTMWQLCPESSHGTHTRQD